MVVVSSFVFEMIGRSGVRSLNREKTKINEANTDPGLRPVFQTFLEVFFSSNLVMLLSEAQIALS